jgi:tyrosine-protein phosphatase SIW14
MIGTFVSLGRAVVLLGILLLGAGCDATPAIPGVRNSAQVSPVLYRSGQPTRAGFEEFKARGVRAVVNIRTVHDDRAVVESLGMRYFHVPVSPFDPRDQEMEQIMRLVLDPANQPVLVYCQTGSDRTGCVVGVYRIVVQGWTHKAAIRELDDYGYLPFLWRIPLYLCRINPEDWRRRLPLAETGGQKASSE